MLTQHQFEPPQQIDQHDTGEPTVAVRPVLYSAPHVDR